MMKQVTIADNLFIYHAKSVFADGDNIGLRPRDFEWQVDDPDTARFVTDSLIKDARGPGQVAWLLEPFFLHPENYITAMSKNFDAVLTHNQYFALHNGWLYYPHGGSRIALEDWDIRKKTKNISILLSDKTSMRGHRLRHEIVERYRDKFDAVLGLDAHVRPIDAYGDYRYSVIVENERAPGYFTERLIDCLSMGTVPIYWGAPNITEFFTDESILEFDGVGDIQFDLECADQDHYDSAKEGILANWRIARLYRICEDTIYEKYPQLFGG
jgi:hypothetical protein